MPSFPKNEEFDGSRLISLDCNESKQAGNAKCIACDIPCLDIQSSLKFLPFVKKMKISPKIVSNVTVRSKRGY